MGYVLYLLLFLFLLQTKDLGLWTSSRYKVRPRRAWVNLCTWPSARSWPGVTQLGDERTRTKGCMKPHCSLSKEARFWPVCGHSKWPKRENSSDFFSGPLREEVWPDTLREWHRMKRPWREIKVKSSRTDVFHLCKHRKDSIKMINTPLTSTIYHFFWRWEHTRFI